MFQIRHRDEPIFRCTYEICSRINRDFGYVRKELYSEECCVRDLTEREPRVPCLQ